MHLLFTWYASRIEVYRSWLTQKTYRAQLIFYTPVVAIFVLIVATPAPLLDEIIKFRLSGIIIPLIIFPIIPFYIATWVQVRVKDKKVNGKDRY